jgi:hypothetical protein
MIARYLDALSRGDAVAVGFTLVVAAVGVLILGGVGFVSWREKKREREHQDRLKQRRGY